jgi:serine/threonine protein kinase
VTELSSGEEFAGHRVEDVAGRGAMGVVYRATHLALNVQRALKVITPEHATDEDFRIRFQRESQLAASLDHPNVIPIHHAGEEGGVLYITMRMVEGMDVGAMLIRDGRLEPERAVKVVKEVSDALDVAHGHGLIHRDVKPANVLIENPGPHEHIYLTDFGLTKPIGGGGPTKTGFAVGTFDYMAPEQFQGGDIDGRADVYALACLLYELLTGSVPFVRSSDAQRMYAHMQEMPPAASEMVPGLPAEMDDVIRRGMAKDPDERFGSAGELAAAAAAALRAEPAEATTISPPPSRADRTSISRPPEPAPEPEPSAAGATSISKPDSPAASAPAPAPSKPRRSAPSKPIEPGAGRRPGPSSGDGGGPNKGLIIGGLVALAAIAAVVVLVLGGGGEDGGGDEGGGAVAATDTAEATARSYFEAVAAQDGAAACALLSAAAQQQAINPSTGATCEEGVLGLAGSGLSDPSFAERVRTASLTATESGDTAQVTATLPDPLFANPTVASDKTATIDLARAGDAWQISNIDGLCDLHNIATC